MLHYYCPVRAHADRQEVKPVPVLPTAVTHPPSLRHPADCPALSPAHRLHRRPATARTARLHLDKGNQRALPSDQVHIVPPEPEAVRLDGPAACGEIRQRHAFSPHASDLAGVRPFRDGHERALNQSGGGHATNIAMRNGTAVIPSVRPGAENTKAQNNVAKPLPLNPNPAHPSAWPRTAPPGCFQSSDRSRGS